MDEKLLRRIQKYKDAGWRIEEDNVSAGGVGALISPGGDVFRYDDIRDNSGFVPWETCNEKDERTAMRFDRLYRLIKKFYHSCYLEQGMEFIIDQA